MAGVEVVAAGTFDGLAWGAVGSALALGLRHGFDWDHIAALSDITGSQDDARRSLLFSTLYIVGHAAVVTALGIGAIALGVTVPDWLDAAMGRVVGVTLLGLGAYVLVALVRQGRDARIRSRWMLAAAGIHRVARWIRARRVGGSVVIEHDHDHRADGAHHPEVEGGIAAEASPARSAVAVSHRHRHVHFGSMPDDPFTDYGVGTSLGVGVLHGIGGETPTQMLLFASAAGAGTAWVGVTFLLAFVVGLAASNTVVAVGTRLGILNAARNFVTFATVSVVVAALSLYLGTVFLFDAGEGIPAIFG